MSTFLIVQCSDKSIPQIHLGQGILVGEVTDHTAIFQARLTTSDTLINGHLPGQEGWIKFQYFEEGDENMALRETDWIAANPSYDFIAKTKVNNLSQNQVSELLTRPPKFNVSRNISRELKLPSIFVYAVTVSLLP